ncbi:MAG: HEPN domain-containing protein [Byssovorax sp.]
MSVERRIAGLLDIATEDASGALTLAQTGNRNSAYLCQQAAEKLIKAILLDQGIEAGTEHHLDVLVGRLPDTHPWKARLRTLDKYTPYATAYRYPGSGGRVPSAPDAKQVAADSALITQWIAKARGELGKRSG